MYKHIQLTIQLPHRIFLDQERVKKLRAESKRGTFGILPNRLDCVAALVPGILSYETQDSREFYIAVDEGILVKEKNRVFVAVKNAIGDVPLDSLKTVVAEELLRLDERESKLRESIALLEGSMFGSLIEVSHGRK